jgi:hypothetical protein
MQSERVSVGGATRHAFLLHPFLTFLTFPLTQVADLDQQGMQERFVLISFGSSSILHPAYPQRSADSSQTATW